MTESGDDAVMNPPNELSQTLANSIGPSVLALGGMVPAFTGNGGGPSAKDFLEVLIQVGKWADGTILFHFLREKQDTTTNTRLHLFKPY